MAHGVSLHLDIYADLQALARELEIAFVCRMPVGRREQVRWLRQRCASSGRA